MQTRLVEFYVLWQDKTWTVEQVILEGPEAERDDCVELAQAKLEANFTQGQPVETIGPFYHLGELEDNDAKD